MKRRRREMIEGRRGGQLLKICRYVVPVLSVMGLAFVSGCDYARMKDQESVRTYKEEIPEMDGRTIPSSGGYEVLKHADTAGLRNPLPMSDGSRAQGKEAYSYFCVHCHGITGDGNGTVGQSFSPLPTDLRSPSVQSQTDGELYAKTMLGFRRHPPLYTTVSERDCWAIINYVRSLSGKASEGDGGAGR